MADWWKKYPGINNKTGARKTPLKLPPPGGQKVTTIRPDQYDPKRHLLVKPEAAYSYNQGRKAGTLSSDFNIRSIEAGPKYKKTIRNAPAQQPMGQMNDTTREMLRRIQLSQPSINQNQFRRMLPQLQQNGMMPLANMSPMGNDPISQIQYAIGQVESTGNYGATNFNDPGGGAWGKYQILATNIGPWTQEALGFSMSPQEFLANPEAQDATARYMMEKYYNQFGQDPNAVARAWNAGPGRATEQGAVQGYVSKFQTAYGSYNATGQMQPQTMQMQQALQGMQPSNMPSTPGFQFPIQNMRQTNNPFGAANSRYASGRHRGVDFPAAGGTPIAAVTGGRVLEAGYNGAWGNTLLMADPTGQYTIRYSHMNSLPAVGVGQTVQQGQILGGVGSTGRSTGNHLDLEIMRNGQLIDPMTVLR